MEVSFAETPKPKSPYRPIIRIIVFLYVMTYLTSDKPGIPTPMDVFRFTVHIIARALEFFQIIISALSSAGV